MKRQGAWWVMVVLAVMAGCGPRAPHKPAGVPTESFWVGTRKSGVFVVIGPKDKDGWRIQIFDDHAGTAKAEGVYTLRGIARSEITASDVAAYDGTALHLVDGALLVPRVQH